MSNRTWNVMVTGGAGYVGSVLVPKLLEAGHKVTVLDLYLYGEVFEGLKGHAGLREIKGDIRDISKVEEALSGCDAVIHLACISNDPSYDLDPNLGRSINHDAFRPLVQAAKRAGVERFIYASSSSVYGIKDEPEVTEDLSLEPLTDYSRFKALCEQELLEERAPGFTVCTIRPSTVCGFAPRQRLDVVVNIFTNQAVNNGKIRVTGGPQKRPNIHIEDMAAVYLYLLDQPAGKIDGKIWNAGDTNFPISQLAEIVRKVVGEHVEIETLPTNDPRSYHVSGKKIRDDIGFELKYTIEDAVRGLAEAMKSGKLTDPLNNPMYFNIKRMQQVELK
ncbi:nucleoside-diphosphate-sugar epimerase [Paramagnetospirillum caucaseum]|uniref:Nucleoside-diphosphate-sugar epimerase n=1 Tax=Paramagnetospirillum caucaseum TaxID=1244869 RepID=M2Z8B4_9PROT|nr:NAD-dependent epimerase/dehydratase family protein [Paramagnetospirillum caucaseum]EME70550.1 nucleoside-diphosphate-sugar epimerase [Paramagnetospirillum caucaseum]